MVADLCCLLCCRLIEVEYAEIQDRKVRGQLQNVGAIERQVSKADVAVSLGKPSCLMTRFA